MIIYTYVQGERERETLMLPGQVLPYLPEMLAKLSVCLGLKAKWRTVIQCDSNSRVHAHPLSQFHSLITVSSDDDRRKG